MSLHSAWVHIPIAMILFAPIATFLSLYFARKPGSPLKFLLPAWHFLLIAALYTALAFGDQDKDARKWENDVQIENHRDSAQILFIAAIVTFFPAVLTVKKGSKKGFYTFVLILELVSISLCWKTVLAGHTIVFNQADAFARPSPSESSRLFENQKKP